MLGVQFGSCTLQKIAILILMSSLSLGLAAPSDDPDPNDQRHYRDPILPLLVGGIIGPQEKTFIIRVRTVGGEIPEPGPKLEIHSSSGPIVLHSDSDGFLKYPFSVALVKENPTYTKLVRELVYELRLTSVTKPGIRQRTELSAGNKPIMEHRSFRIWYPPQQKEEAKVVFEYLQKSYTFIQDQLSIEPTLWGINLTERDLSDINYTTLQDYPKWYTWSYPIDEIRSSKGQKSNVHEWVEHTLIERAGLEQLAEGGSNRFVFDGLAEYIGIRFTKYVPAYYESKLQELIDKDEVTVNLPGKFQWQAKQFQNPQQLTEELTQFTSGYPLSFVFWERICEKHGRDLPGRFVTQLQQETQSDYETCLKVLEHLTKAHDIRSQLESMDVRNTVQVIRDLSLSLQQKTAPTHVHVNGNN